MTELNDAVAAAVAKWQEYREPCHRRVFGPPLPLEVLCPGCERPLTDEPLVSQPPEVKALIESVTVPDSHHEACPEYGGCFVDNPKVQDSYKTGRPSCQGTGRAPRDWEKIGEGALAGRLGSLVDGLLHNDQAHVWEKSTFAATAFDDEGTLAAVDKALEQMYGGKP